MNIKTNLILLISTYILSVILNSFKSHIMPSYVALIFLLLCYSGLSISLTVKMNNAGAFQWISTNSFIIKIVLIIGLLGILYAVYNAMMIKADWSTYQNQSISHSKDFLAFTSYIWIPLLMIIPFAMAVFENEMAINQSAILKAALILNVIIGIIIYIFLHKNNIIHILLSKFNSNENSYSPEVEKIKSSSKLEDYIHYTFPYYSKRTNDAAFAKLKSDPDWDAQFYQNLEDCNNKYSIGMIHEYLSLYTFEYPEKLIAPFGKSISCVATYATEYAANDFTSGNDLDGLQISRILKIIEKQFVGQEKMLFEGLDEISLALKAIKREDYKVKTVELLQMIEQFKKKFEQ